ncbi:hypothetical protein [Catenulispora rubra]|uniref:hypothetical protein n=1 Tax=Catenulispora rubra TaxID=280293 RepID=UPI0018925A06|nr:hypothetical protein [Catenulispora rubra]
MTTAPIVANPRQPSLPNAPWLTARDQEWFGDHLSRWLGAGARIKTPPPAPRAFLPSPTRAALSSDRPRVVAEFFEGCLRVYLAVLAGDVPREVGAALYGDLPEHLGLEFHRSLGAAAVTAPHSFRTDESLDGKIFEIQAPGSGWGEYLLAVEYLADLAGSHDRDTLGTDGEATAIAYTSALRQALGTVDPCVMYLIDTAGGQTGVRYFLERTRAAGTFYFGLDPGIGADDVHHIRSHNLASLFTEHRPALHLARALDEPFLYDQSLNSMFYSKVTTALPFWRHTRSLFSDRDRDLFPYTAILEADGVQMPDGRLASRAAFAHELARRPYLLKYAGSDPYSGSGGTGIHLLDGASTRSLELLNQAWDQSATGRTWIVQEAVFGPYPEWDEQFPDVPGRVPKLSVLCALGTVLGSMILAGTRTIVHAGGSAALAVCGSVCASPVDSDGVSL